MERITAKKLGVKIYKSHKLANGYISITWAKVYNATTISTQTTSRIENKGGAVKSLAYIMGEL